MKVKACRLRFEGFRYEIKADGSVWGQVITESDVMGRVDDPVVAQQIRDEAARLRRNRTRRERHQAHLDLGLKRNRDGSYE